MKELLCKAFCDQLSVREVKAGLAVSTAWNLSNGEPLGFYIVGPDLAGHYRIQDDGTTIPLIEAAGIDLDTQTRSEATLALYEEYGAEYNPETGELSTPPLPADQIPPRVMRFIALLLRLQDLILLTPERVASTFREDAIQAIRLAIGGRATISENQSPVPGVEFPADLFIVAPQRAPVAVFLAMSEQRVLEAMFVQLALRHEVGIDVSVVALLEKDTSVSRRLRQRASNRLAAMPIFEGDEQAAVQRIEREVIGRTAAVH